MLKYLLLLVAAWSLTSCCDSANIDAELARQALDEYDQPIRPASEGRNPCWNKFANRFIYAPTFDFSTHEGAANYRYTVMVGDESWSFTADVPTAPLTEIWRDVKVGDAKLTVEAMDAAGKVIDTVGCREFRRDCPFCPPYNQNVRPYREAAVMALLYVHNMEAVQHWKGSQEPLMSYSHNTYPAKIVSATIRAELLLASLVPSYREEALQIAENAAAFLMAQSRKKDEPLAYFPPTYYKDLIVSGKDWNVGKTMMMEACSAANAYLDLYITTGKPIYLEYLLGIPETYQKLQREDGSFPVKVDFATGEAVNGASAMLHPLISYLDRLHNTLGVRKYEPLRKRCERWMEEVAIERFDMSGQFEDVSVLGVEPYENLTNCTAAPYASYLLLKSERSDKEFRNAIDLIRLSEDQFTYWNDIPNGDGVRRLATPCVLEQYKYRTPVDNSAANVAHAFMSLYEATGSQLALAKAKALVDNITVMQCAGNGQIPTTWDYRSPKRHQKRTFWINCTFSSVIVLMRMEALLAKIEAEQAE